MLVQEHYTQSQNTFKLALDSSLIMAHDSAKIKMIPREGASDITGTCAKKGKVSRLATHPTYKCARAAVSPAHHHTKQSYS